MDECTLRSSEAVLSLLECNFYSILRSDMMSLMLQFASSALF
jgi:hypothetical protein